MLSVELFSCCSFDVFGQYFEVQRVKCSATVPPFSSNEQNNSTLSPGFLGQRFNNLQLGCTFDVILTSSVQYDKILSKFGQQQLVMVNYACGFNQSETGKYFEWIIRIIITKGYKEWKSRSCKVVIGKCFMIITFVSHVPEIPFCPCDPFSPWDPLSPRDPFSPLLNKVFIIIMNLYKYSSR